MEVEGAKIGIGNMVWMAVGAKETALQETTSISEYKEYIGLASLETTLIYVKWHCPILWLLMRQQGPIAKLPEQILVTIHTAGKASIRKLCQGSSQR